MRWLQPPSSMCMYSCLALPACGPAGHMGCRADVPPPTRACALPGSSVGMLKYGCFRGNFCGSLGRTVSADCYFFSGTVSAVGVGGDRSGRYQCDRRALRAWHKPRTALTIQTAPRAAGRHFRVVSSSVCGQVLARVPSVSASHWWWDVWCALCWMHPCTADPICARRALPAHGVCSHVRARDLAAARRLIWRARGAR
jgi:hypothetical protein